MSATPRFGRGVHQRTARGASAVIELADAARHQIDQNVGIPNLLQSFFCEFSVQVLFQGLKTSAVH